MKPLLKIITILALLAAILGCVLASIICLMAAIKSESLAGVTMALVFVLPMLVIADALDFISGKSNGR